MNENPISIIAIDGTSSSGKGTIAYKIAEYFGYHYLNSGALYRLVAYIALKNNVNLSHKEAIVQIAQDLKPYFKGREVIVDGVDIWPLISTQEYGNHASAISPLKELREALFDVQREMISYPGLVAEGRDMCTHVFTDAKIKLYLDADVTIRAERRLQDEEKKGTGKTLEMIIEELEIRDHRDMTRELGRLYPADGACIIDTGGKTREEVFALCIEYCEQQGLKKL
jgi:cytidylate kinase